MEDTGGPAYPTQTLNSNCGVDYIEYENGMTLRDYFAGQALTTITAGYGYDRAKSAYKIADEMIKERNKWKV